jgi:hypothetical protein
MKGSMIKEHDRIVLKTDLPADGLEAGDVGTVVHIYADGAAYEVEFTTLDGGTAAVVTVEAGQARSVHKREITHARELQPA